MTPRQFGQFLLLLAGSSCVLALLALALKALAG